MDWFLWMIENLWLGLDWMLLKGELGGGEVGDVIVGVYVLGGR